jgi:hypothetical protein
LELLQQISKEGKPLDMIIISYDEKPGIQAIGNRYPDLMPILGKHATVSHDHEYIQHGTISLLAGIDLLTGIVHYKTFDNHRSVEFIEFLKSLDSAYPKHIKIVVILDNVRFIFPKKLRNMSKQFHSDSILSLRLNMPHV